GKEGDEETGLYYHGARYYAPWLGRWTAADPIGIRDDLNLYRYARANPIRISDPSGTECDDSIATCSDPRASVSQETENQRSSVFDREVDKINDENARFRMAAETGQLKPQPFDAEEFKANVDAALKNTETTEYKVARAKAAAERQRQAEYQADLAKEAEVQKELPGTLASVVPIYGSGKSTIVHFSHGNYGRAAVYGVLTISDVF